MLSLEWQGKKGNVFLESRNFVLLFVLVSVIDGDRFVASNHLWSLHCIVSEGSSFCLLDMLAANVVSSLFSICSL